MPFIWRSLSSCCLRRRSSDSSSLAWYSINTFWACSSWPLRRASYSSSFCTDARNFSCSTAISCWYWTKKQRRWRGYHHRSFCHYHYGDHHRHHHQPYHRGPLLRHIADKNKKRSLWVRLILCPVVPETENNFFFRVERRPLRKSHASFTSHSHYGTSILNL